jgi:hypothetical protein
MCTPAHNGEALTGQQAGRRVMPWEVLCLLEV